MLLEVCREVNNFFEISKETGKLEILDSIINLSGKYIKGQYIAVTGSILNDGVYLLADSIYTLEGSKDETFEGIVYGLAVPPDFLVLVKDIEAFVEKQGVPSTINSESFGSYSYSKNTDGRGGVLMWQDVFRAKLNRFRKMFSEVKL